MRTPIRRPAIRRANAKFERRFSFIENALAANSKAPSDAALEEMERLWTGAKKTRKANHPLSGIGPAMPRAAFHDSARAMENPPPAWPETAAPLHPRRAAAAGNFRRTGSTRSGMTRTRT